MLNSRINVGQHITGSLIHKLKAGSQAAPQNGDDISRLPVLQKWIRTQSAICMLLTDGCMQINWFEVYFHMLQPVTYRVKFAQ